MIPDPKSRQKILHCFSICVTWDILRWNCDFFYSSSSYFGCFGLCEYGFTGFIVLACSPCMVSNSLGFMYSFIYSSFQRSNKEDIDHVITVSIATVKNESWQQNTTNNFINNFINKYINKTSSTNKEMTSCYSIQSMNTQDKTSN